MKKHLLSSLIRIVVLAVMVCCQSLVSAQTVDSAYVKAVIDSGRAYYGDKDYKAALQYFEKAAELGNAQAADYVGYMYQNGLGVNTDLKEAIKWYKRAAADSTYVEGLESIGYIYADSDNKDWYNPKEAFQLFTRAAAKNSAASQNMLGVMYHTGEGIPQDDSIAVTYYRLAAEQGYTRAQYNLGSMYMNGNGVKRDDSEAMEWFEKAAEKGHLSSQNDLGVLYMRGTGRPKNPEKAFYWYSKAAEKGDATAELNLAGFYERGEVVAKDLAKAAELYLSSAIKGLASSQECIAFMYLNGKGVKPDYKQALNWYKAAAKQDNSYGYLGLGTIYENGYGVDKNEALAVDNYLKSAKLGNKSGQYSLALCYENGRGVKKDTDAALEWYKKAADQGHSGAMNNYAWISYLRKENLQEAQLMVAECLRLAPEDFYAMDTYAHLLFLGENYGRAEEWQRKALETGAADRPSYVEMYGDILFKLGRAKEALKHWKKAVKLGSTAPLLAKKIADEKYYEE